MKAAPAVTTDEELASKIGYSKQALTNWRRRNGILHKAELRIVRILGQDFAIRAPLIVTGWVKWDDFVHGLAVFAVDQYISHWPLPLSYPHIRAIGRRFGELEGEIFKLLLAYPAASYTQEEIFDAVMRAIEKREDRQIDELMTVFESEDFIENEAGLISQRFRNPTA